MLQARCIRKFRDNNKQIKGYRLKDNFGKTIDVTPEQLKNAIINNKIQIVNLTLTSDGRLIDAAKTVQTPQVNTTVQQISTHMTQQNDKTSSEKFNAIRAKAQMMDIEIKKYSFRDFNIEMLTLQDKHIIYIDEHSYNLFTRAYDNTFELFAEILHDLSGTIKIMGGKNLSSTKFMFYECKDQVIDITDLEISDNTDIKLMFQKCESKIITNNQRILDELNNGKKFHNISMNNLEDVILGYKRAIALSKRNKEWCKTLNIISDNHTIPFYVPNTNRIHYYGETFGKNTDLAMVSIDLSYFTRSNYNSYRYENSYSYEHEDKFYTKKTLSQCKDYKEGKTSLPLWGGSSLDYCRTGKWYTESIDEFYSKYGAMPYYLFEDIIAYRRREDI